MRGVPNSEKVYHDLAPHYIIGPPFRWQRGDRVHLPDKGITVRVVGSRVTFSMGQKGIPRVGGRLFNGLREIDGTITDGLYDAVDEDSVAPNDPEGRKLYEVIFARQDAIAEAREKAKAPVT